MARPTDYTEEIAAKICDRLMGGDSLRTICKEDDFPVCSTVFLWLAKHEDFRTIYAAARELQQEAYLEAMLEEACDRTGDLITVGEGEKQSQAPNSANVARSKLIADNYKWIMARLAPRKYGDKITQELTGAGGAPLTAVINVTRGAKPPSSSETG